MRTRPLIPVSLQTGLGLLACTLAVQTGAQTKTSAPTNTANTTTAKNVTAPAPPSTPKIGSPVTSLAFSADGKKLAVGFYGQVALFDTGTWQPVAQFKQVVDSARTLAFQPGGSLLAIGCGLPGRSGVIELWDTAGSDKPFVYPQQADTVEAVAFNKDGKEILLGSNDNKAHLYTSLTASTGTAIDAHNGRVTAVAFSPIAGSLYVTGGMDKIVKVWVEKTGQNVCNFDQCDSGLTGLVFLNNGTQFVGSGLDGKLYWWGVSHDDRKDTYGGYFFRQFEAHPGGIYALSGSQNGQRIITGGADKVVCIWNPDNGQKIHEFKDCQTPIYAVALSPDGKIAASGGPDGQVHVWDIEANKLINTLVPPASTPAVSTPAVRPHAH